MKPTAPLNWLAILSFGIPAAALPLFYGYIRREIHAPIVITSVLVGCWLWWGGRIGPSKSALPSFCFGWPLAALIVFPFYYLGRWLAL